jgi:hypothetical protein
LSARLRRAVRTAAKLALLPALCVVVSAVALESAYRLALFDPYRGELNAYNPPEVLEEERSRPTLLIFGDSETAGRGGYVDRVREARPDLRVINGGIPGSFVMQANLVAGQRFARFEPSLVLYQVNVGNDLLNARYPVSWGELSPVRNLYWTLAHRLRFLEYGNYKLGQLGRARQAAKLQPVVTPAVDEPCRYDLDAFDPASYTERERRYIRAEPALFENQALLRPARQAAFERLVAGIGELLGRCEPPSCRPFLLVVPHASQIDEGYQRALARLGAEFREPERLLADESPFLEALGDRLHRPDLRILDARPTLRQAAREGEHTYFLHDPHLNGCGQRRLAELVLASLP